MTGHRKWSEIRNAMMDESVHRYRRDELRRVNDFALRLGRLRDQREALTAQGPRVADGVIDQYELAIHDIEYLAALRQSIEEFGGRLEITAVFPDQRITLSPESCADEDRADEREAANAPSTTAPRHWLGCNRC